MPSILWRVSRHLPASASACASGIALLVPSAASAQTARAVHPPEDNREILVVGQRQSAVVALDPVATFDSKAIAAIGATSMNDLMRVIKPLAQSADGSDPILLLNGQRVSSYDEIGSLPPEALERVEVLPEPAALRFGYPPTRRVVNFITKRNFRQVEVRVAAGTTTRPGSTSEEGAFNLTRLHKDQRITVALERTHASALRQSDRHVLPDPDILFDGVGNITGFGGGEIDPALSALTGETVTVAQVPEAVSARSALPAYAVSANQPRPFDLGPYRLLSPRKDGWKAETVIGDRLGGSTSGTLDISAQQDVERSVSGPAPATLTVPASNPYSPFANDVLLDRYLTEADPLRDRKTTTALHGGATLRGAIAGWLWDWTGNVDWKRVSGFSENGIDVTAANAAIAAGVDPFAPVAPALLSNRLIDRSHLITRSENSKFVATKRPVDLPAGPVTLTATVEGERVSSSSVTRGANPFDLHLARTRTEAALALDVPLTSRKDHVLAGVGNLSINGSATIRRVSGFGSLNDRTAGLSWSPISGIQLLLQDKRSAAAPDMEKLATPVATVANVPLFDYATGRTEIVTLTTGGNPNLLAMRKHVRSVALNLKPWPKREIRLTATYESTDTRDQTGDIYATTPELEGLFPERFVRDSNGRLTAVTFQPTNFYRERQQVLDLVLNANGLIGPKRNDPKTGKSVDRANFWAGAGPVIRFSDRLQLRPGTPVFDLLRGDTVTGGPRPRVTTYFFAGFNYLGNGGGIDGWYQSSGRVRSDVPASDLFFGPVFKLNAHASISVHHFLRHADWTHHLQLKIEFENLIYLRERVHDRTGAVPNRFQPDLLDPLGRTVKLTIRKLF